MPEEAEAIRQAPAMLVKHDRKIANLVHLLQFSPTREHAKMLRNEIRVRFLVHQANPDPFLENTLVPYLHQFSEKGENGLITRRSQRSHYRCSGFFCLC